MKIIIYFSLLLVLIPTERAAWPAANQSPEAERLLKTAKEHGETELNLSWGSTFGAAQGAKKLEAVFNRMYGTAIKFNFTPGPSMTQMAGKISLEVTAGQKPSSDILLGTESHFTDLLSRPILEEYDYAKLSPRMLKEVVSYKNMGVEIAGIVAGVSYNRDLVQSKDVPKKLEDVLHPKWKGKIASTINAAIFDRVAARPEWEPEKMKSFIRKLSGQVAGLLRCQENDRIISGEFHMMVLNCGSYQIRREKAKGAPLEHVVLEDAASVGFFQMGVPRNSLHPNLAKLYINMMMSPEGQKLIYEMEYTDHYELPGSQSAVELAHLKSKGINVQKVDVKFLSDRPDLPKLSDELRRLLQQKQGS